MNGTRTLHLLDALSDGDAATASRRATDRRRLALVADLEADAAYGAAARREQLDLAWDLAQGDGHAEQSVLADAALYDADHGLTGRNGSLHAELLATTLAVAA